MLVRAEVERADRHRLAFHPGGDGAVRLELLVLGRQPLAVQEEELGAEQTDAHRAVVERLREIAGKLDVGLELDREAIERGRGLRLQPAQLRAPELELALLQPVLGENRLVRIDDDDVIRPVEDQELVFTDQRAAVVGGRHRRDGEAPRDDRRVRRHAAQVRDEARVSVRLELDDVGGRQIVRDQDRVLFGARRNERAGLAEQALQHALDDLDDVGLALAQVGVLDLLELSDEHVHLLRERPLGVAVLLGDDALRFLGKRGVRENHRVHVEDGAELRRRVAGSHRAVQPFELGAHFRERVVEASDLALHAPRGNRVVGNFERGVRNELRAPDGDPARYADSV